MAHNVQTWILVANSSEAKIYQQLDFPKIMEVTRLKHPESRLKNLDLVTGEPGRNFDRGGTTRHSYENELDPKKAEVEKFARELGAFLNKAHAHGDFGRLYLIVSPTFLGMLRHTLDQSVQQAIIAEAAKDLHNYSTLQIEEYLVSLREM